MCAVRIYSVKCISYCIYIYGQIIIFHKPDNLNYGHLGMISLIKHDSRVRSRREVVIIYPDLWDPFLNAKKDKSPRSSPIGSIPHDGLAQAGHVSAFEAGKVEELLKTLN